MDHSEHRAVRIVHDRHPAEAGEVSLDRLGGHDPGPALDAAIDRKRILSRVMHVLTAREREVIRARFVEEATLLEVGERLGVVRQRVQQIERRAIRKMRLAAAGKRNGDA